MIKTSGASTQTALRVRLCLPRMMCAVLITSLFVFLGTAPNSAFAGDHSDHDRARQALQAGKVMSLRQVLDLVTAQFLGEPIEIEFDEDDGKYYYEIKLLQPAGNIVKLKIDARTGDVISLKGRNIQFKGKP